MEARLEREPALGGDAASTFLHGRVADSCGGSVAAAEVRLERVDGEDALVVTTTEEGAWRQDVAPGTWRVRASKDGFGVSVAVELDTVTPEAASRLELRLLRPVVVRGCVVGSGGVPLAGAVVQVDPVGGTDVGVSTSCRLTSVDPSGRFEFEAAIGFALELTASLGGKRVVPARRIVVQERCEVVLGTADAFCLRGLVLDDAPAESGSSSEGVAIPGWGMGTEVFVDGTAVEVAADGSFVAHTGVASVEVQAHLGERSSEIVVCTFDCGRTSAYVPLRLRRNLSTRGVVVDVDGERRGGMAIESLAGQGPRRRVVALCTTKSDGAFELPLPAGSRWWLRVLGGEVAEVVAGQHDVRLRCGVGRKTVGWPLRLHDGSALAGPSLKAVWATIGPEGVVRETAMVARVAPPDEASAVVANGPATDASAPVQWLLREMRPAPWSLFVDGATARLPQMDRTMLRDVVVDEDESCRIDVRLTRRGEPVVGVDVTVVNAVGSANLQFATGGRHRFGSLARVGPLLVRVWRGGELLASRLVDLQPGSEQQVAIELP